MPSSRPVLYVFAISHYCEKVRWALDYLNIEYELRHVAPGVHREIAKKLGAPGTSVPILVSDGHVVQGSAEIIDWAEALAATASTSLIPAGARDECLEIERRLDEVAGVHVRRFFYSEALVDYPETVKPILTKGIPFLHKLLVSWKWQLIRKLMIKGMDLGPEQFEDSRRVIEGELDWLDGLLSSGRHYLAGDQLSRADITAASLLAPLATPPEHPTYQGLELPPRLATDVLAWEKRPSIRWVREIYRQYR